VNLFAGDSFRFLATRPEGLDEIMENISRVVSPYLPGEDASVHIAALLAIEPNGSIQITIEPQTDQGREALRRLAEGAKGWPA
jgi:hypothetical protein